MRAVDTNPEPRDGLAPCPQTATPGGVVAAVLVGSVLAGTGLVDAIWPRDLPSLTVSDQRELASREAAATWTDGTAMRSLEYRRRLRSPSRAWLGPIHAAARLRWLGEAKPRVVVGEGGMLFHGSRTWLPEEQHERAAARGAGIFSIAARRFGGLGCELIAVPVPRKSTVLSDRFPKGPPRAAEFDGFAIEVFRSAGVSVVDLQACFARQPKDDRYLLVDTHWTQGMRAAAAQAIAEQAGLALTEPATRLVAEPWTPLPTDLLRLAGVGDRAWARQLLDIPSAETFRLEGALEHPDEPVLAHFGTSFSVDLASYLSHFTGRKVHDGHRAASRFLESLDGLESRGTEALAFEQAWVEFPVYTLFPFGAENVRLQAELGQLLATLPAGVVTPLPASQATSRPAAPRWVTVAPGGLVVDPGLASLLLEATKIEGPSDWRVRADGVTYDARWRAKQRSLRLPVLDVGTLGARVQIQPVGASQPPRGLRATWVTGLDLARQTPGAIGPPQRAAAAAFERTLLRPGDGLVGVLRGPRKAVQAVLTFRFASGAEHQRSALVRGRAAVALDLGRWSGEELVSVTCAPAAGGEPSAKPARRQVPSVRWLECAIAPRHIPR